MLVNHFQLSAKCPFNCLKCSIQKANTKKYIFNKITLSPKGTLNLLFNLTNENTELPQIISHIKESKQKFGLFYNGLANEEYLKYSPDLILFPMFSTIPENHDMFTGKKNYHNMLSFLNALPKKIQKPIIFFVTKDNLSETPDLSGLLLTLKTQIYIQPLSFYEKEDFDKETILYLQRIGKQKGITLLPIGKKKAHCLNWNPPTNLLQQILDFIMTLTKK